MNGRYTKLFGGIEAGGTKFICGISDADGNVLDTIRIPTTTPNETLSAAARFFEEGIVRLGNISALSIGSFGPLSLRTSALDYGHITSTPKLGWSNIDLVGHFVQHLRVRTR